MGGGECVWGIVWVRRDSLVSEGVVWVEGRVCGCVVVRLVSEGVMWVEGVECVDPLGLGLGLGCSW